MVDEFGIGLVCSQIVQKQRVVVGEIGSKNSALKTIPSIVQVSLNLSQETTQHFLQILEISAIIIPRMNLYQS
ncbi:hypothetical protein E1A91_D02G138600v1 [Gossypium mustelinum]|uniref:Uncharacterized protein n=4 Tax=Gossypium TaxID=3633 RepID=A0A5J5SC26_GOSBA|nr:hypothetical protein ES319_D02G132800v1 [Gossypium barbadense]TYG79474.1 hypothetical protein ES288_D02G141000v1 [Gossypium darwinii]TYH83677.1 hypothetical protein ES332_D02G147400v1 [Gossypium tomentosum]TYI93474.1 hypothetical protein E1A91_D02G138600v1 [Gossypium mustelinum]